MTRRGWLKRMGFVALALGFLGVSPLELAAVVPEPVERVCPRCEGRGLVELNWVCALPPRQPANHVEVWEVYHGSALDRFYVRCPDCSPSLFYGDAPMRAVSNPTSRESEYVGFRFTNEGGYRLGILAGEGA